MIELVHSMLEVVWKLKVKLLAFQTALALGLLLVFAWGIALRHSAPAGKQAAARPPANPDDCRSADTLLAPEDVLARIQSEEVSVRRDIFRRLYVRPEIQTAFYDYERDRDFPERVEQARLQLVNLDATPEAEAVISFVRLECPVAIVLKRKPCGWQVVGVLSAWMRFEDYPYADWLEVSEVVRRGEYALVVHDSDGNATFYMRRALVYRLVGERLEQIARIEEEHLTRPEGLLGNDWSGVRRRETRSYIFSPATWDAPATYSVEYRDELIKFTGSVPTGISWRETDGVWQERSRHWRMRECQVLETSAVKSERFIWDERKGYFVAASR